MIMLPQDQKKTKSRTILVSGSCTWFGTIIDQKKEAYVEVAATFYAFI